MVDLEELKKIKSRLSEDIATKSVLEKQIKANTRKMLQQDRRGLNASKAREVLQKIAQDTQKNLEEHISNLTTMALKSILDSGPKFMIRMIRKRNKTEAELLFEEYGSTSKPIDSAGGGALDIASLALRLAKWSLKKNRPVMLLDEPFRNLDHSRQAKAGKLLKILHEKMGIQFIVISHQPEVDQYSDRIFEVQKNGKESTIKILE